MSKSVFIEKSDPSFQISVNAVTSTLALVELYSAPLGRYKSEVRDSYKIESLHEIYVPRGRENYAKHEKVTS